MLERLRARKKGEEQIKNAEEKMSRRLWAAVVPWAADEEICNLRVGKKDHRPCQAPSRDHTRLKRVGQSIVPFFYPHRAHQIRYPLLLSSHPITAVCLASTRSASSVLESRSRICGTSTEGETKPHQPGKGVPVLISLLAMPKVLDTGIAFDMYTRYHNGSQ